MNWYEILFLKYLKGLPSKARMFLSLAKGGTMQLQPVNDDEPETSPFKGVIRYPDTSSDIKDEFTYKQSDYTGQARIKSIKGNTLVWNQHIENIGANYSTLSSTVNSASNITCTSSGGSGRQFFGIIPKEGNSNYSFIAGHKYFFSINIVSRSVANFSSFKLESSLNGQPESTTISTGRFCSILTPSSAGAKSFNCTQTAQTANTDTFTFNSLVLVDLTQMFGGNEPTIEEFRFLFNLPYYAYDSGSLLNFNGTGIKTTGKNLFDGTVYLDNHAINVSGVIYPTTSSKIYTVTLPVGNYIISATNNGSSSSQPIRAMSVDGNLTSLDFRSVLISPGHRESVTFSVPSGTVQTLISVYNSFGDIMLQSGSTATTYEPYTTSTTSLPISTYFTNGMKSVDGGRVYDELSDKAITRIGSIVADGTLDYSFSASDSGNWATINLTGKLGKVDSAKVQLISSNTFTPIAFNDRTSKSTIFRCYINDSGNLVLRLPAGDTTFTNSTGAKTYFASNPVYLNYELATYTEQDVDPEDTQLMLNRALSTILGRTVSVDNPQSALDILTKGE